MERIVRSFAFEVLGGPDLDKVAPELARDWWQTIVEAPLTKHASPGGVRGSPNRSVGRLLTHKQAVTTQRYAHLSDEAMRRAVEESAEVITPKRNGKVIEWEIGSA